MGHFNFSDSNQLKAIAQAAMETGLPVAVGLSEGEREYFPITHARALVDIYNAQGAQIYLNADHTYSIEKVRAAIDAGVDSVVVDGAKLSFADNVALCKAAVAYAQEKHASSSTALGAINTKVLIEGELGYIGTSSAVMDALPEGAAATEELMTKPEELQELVAQTGIDLVAPAVGNIHGIVLSGQPKLSISRIAALSAAVNPTPGVADSTGHVGVPLVLHGGSGSSDEEFVAAVKAGVVIIHINTDLRLAYRDSLRKTLTTSEETTPYKFLTPSVTAMQAYVAQKLRLFAGQ